MRKDLFTALSLANLCLLDVWAHLLPDDSYRYFIKFPPAPDNYTAAILNVFLLSAGFWTLMTLARRFFKGPALISAKVAFLLVLTIPLNSVRVHLTSLSLQDLSARFGAAGLAALALFLAIFAVFVLLRWHRPVISIASVAVLALFPFVLVTFTKSAWILANYNSTDRCAIKPPPYESKNTPGPIMLWIIFDELDQRLTFPERPGTVKLPEFDRLRGQSIYACNAYPPAGTTLLSVPALITGRLISQARPVSAGELEITFAGAREAVKWSGQPNVFSKAREAGHNTAVVGWYHPYGRVIGGSLNACSCYMLGMSVDILKMPVPKRMISQLALLPNSIPMVRRIPVMRSRYLKQERMDYIMIYRNILDDAKKAVTGPDPGLVLVHWPVPHPPGIYNRFEKELVPDRDSSYLDNLELADHSLGELRRTMESAGRWKNATVLVTSDHWWRINLWKPSHTWTREDDLAAANGMDQRVPFLLKLAGQKESVTYAPSFNTVLTHDLILTLLSGELSDPESVIRWLNRRSRNLPHSDPHPS